MSRLSFADWGSVERAFGISQAPLFLLRKLQQDPTVDEIARSCSGKAILEELKKSIRRKPRLLKSAAKPYALLVALSRNPEFRYLKEAAEFEAPHAIWYSRIAQTLVGAYRPITRNEVSVPTQVGASVSLATGSTTNSEISRDDQ